MACLDAEIAPVSRGLGLDVRDALCGSSFCVSVVDTRMSLCVGGVPSMLSVQVGLVCDTGIDTYCYLRVDEGRIITIDGKYIKVIKE